MVWDRWDRMAVSPGPDLDGSVTRAGLGCLQSRAEDMRSTEGCVGASTCVANVEPEKSTRM